MGTFTSPTLPDPDWVGRGRAPSLAQVSLRETVADPDLIPLDVLAAEAPWSGWLYLQGSGVRVPPAVAERGPGALAALASRDTAETSGDLRRRLPFRG